MSKRFEQPYLLPEKGSYSPCELISADPYLTYRSENGEIVETQIVGAYNIGNVAYALAIAKFFGPTGISKSGYSWLRSFEQSIPAY